jgi:hypothetical protein
MLGMSIKLSHVDRRRSKCPTSTGGLHTRPTELTGTASTSATCATSKRSRDRGIVRDDDRAVVSLLFVARYCADRDR